MYIYGDIIIAVIFLFSILIGLFFIYRNHGWHKNLALHRYLKQASAVFTILFSSAVVLQVLNYNRERQTTLVKQYQDLAKEFYNDTLQIFINNPEMGYYFEHLFNNVPISPNVVRHPTREKEITYLILSRLGTVMSYEQIMDPQSRDFLNKWIKQIVSNFVKSPIFLQYLKEYQQHFGGYLSAEFIKKNFNID